ncbi:hypothetical protein DITRI_Ditri07aG0122300 [Diplodiscus trichospermus]
MHNLIILIPCHVQCLEEIKIHEPRLWLPTRIAIGTELADTYFSDIVIVSSSGKEVHDLWVFYLHAALLRQAFAHYGKFPTVAFRRSLGCVSIPI